MSLPLLAQPSAPLAPHSPVTPAVVDPGTDPFFGPLDSASGTEFLIPVASTGEPDWQSSFLNLQSSIGVRFLPHIDYRMTYATGVRVLPGRTEDTLQHSLSPGLLLQGQRISIDYTPTLSYYSKGSYSDTINHNLAFQSAFGYGDWSFSLAHNYSVGSQALIETARQSDFERHATSLSAHYRFTEKTSFDFSLSQSLQDTTGFNSSQTWSTMNWANYHLTDRTVLGLGVGGGYSKVELGSDMTYEMIQGRIGSHPTDRISLDLNGGIEIRQFLDTDAGDRINPIMGASASYSPFEQTTLSLRADRSVNTSLFQDQITESTSVTASVSQRFLSKLNGTLSGGYRLSDYQSTSDALEVDRSDEVTFISTTLGTRILKKGTVSIFYTHTENSSTLEGYGFNSNQYGLQLGYRF